MMTKAEPQRAMPLPPGSTLGILGGGQLARMMATAAARLGLRTCVLDPAADPPARHVADHVRGGYADAEALAELSRRSHVVTYEFENVDADAAGAISVPVRPGLNALRVAQDRLLEKQMLAASGVATAPFLEVTGDDSVAEALARWGTCVVKTRRFGYDGKGQVVVNDAAGAAAAWPALGNVPCIVEGWVSFALEVSVLVARAADGSVAVYDVVENHHQDNILRKSVVPAGIAADVATRARDLAVRVAQDLDYVGVLGVELFVDDGGEVRVNELAPRVHNSGHWTIDACATSQFEQHVRAVCGWPLGIAERHSDAVMENLIGHDIDAWPQLAAEPGACLHIYGKSEVRPGRKMGHVTRISPRRRVP